MAVVKALGFTDAASVWINNQPPGVLMGRHVDSVSCFTYEGLDRNLRTWKKKLLRQEKIIGDMDYDKSLRQPKELPEIYRCFVALEDWQPGQIVNFPRKLV